jgi:hypothetical protein
MSDRITFNVQLGNKKFVMENDTDYNWLVLYSCIMSKNKISPEEALVNAGLLTHYKHKGENKDVQPGVTDCIIGIN